MYDGLLNIYKEAGYTSFDVVAKLRGILKQKKIGHTGTLDPQAEGVLVVCVGKATKLCDILPDHDKEYIATLRLGITTDTEDLTGTILKRQHVEVKEEALQQAVSSFLGTYDQIPPMYSAVKINGRKLYELARQGMVVERVPRPVTIYQLEILHMELPRVTLRIRCSRGTYIRSLCRDIGEKLGCGGCMETLLRSRACGFSVENSLTLDAVEHLMQTGTLEAYLHPIDTMYPEMPKIYMNKDGDRLVHNGNGFTHAVIGKMTEGCQDDGQETEGGMPRMLVYDSEQVFIGIYEYHLSERRFVPYKMFL